MQHAVVDLDQPVPVDLAARGSELEPATSDSEVQHVDEDALDHPFHHAGEDVHYENVLFRQSASHVPLLVAGLDLLDGFDIFVQTGQNSD